MNHGTVQPRCHERPHVFSGGGLAAKTRSGYSTAVKSYRVHCALNGLAPFSATLTALASWIAELSTKRVKAQTVKKYLTALRSAHVDMGYDGLAVFHHPQLQRIIADMRRLRGKPDTKERCPITKDVLLRLLPLFDCATRGGMTMYAAFCLAFAGFLRAGEFTYSAHDWEHEEEFHKWFLTRRSVSFHDDYIELSLPASKTDPFRQGVTLTIAATGDEACAVTALRRLFHDWPASLSAPLFQIGGSFTRQRLTETLIAVGIDGHYTGHSFRRGAATSAREAGLSEDEIQLLGRWKSDSYRLYTVTHPARILAASRRHQHLPQR